MMLPENALSKEEAEAKASVWWNIDEFPVPCGYDAGRIRECIERVLANSGFCGPVTISAYGDLHQTPEHVLRALSSTGIIINYSCRGARESSHEIKRKRKRPFTLEKCSVSLESSTSEDAPFYCCLCAVKAQTFETFILHLKDGDSHPKTSPETTTTVVMEPPKTLVEANKMKKKMKKEMKKKKKKMLTELGTWFMGT